MRQIVISDLHLGSKNSRVKDILSILEFPADIFILNGDIVDSVNFKRFRKLDWNVLDKIRQLASSDRAILVQGNHDTNLGSTIGIPVVPQAVIFLDDCKWIVVHGDFFDPTLNWPVVADIADWCYQTAQSIHKKSARLAKMLFKKHSGVVESVQRGAAAFAKLHKYSGIITGHTHFADDIWIGGVRYINCGSWVESPSHYVDITDHGIFLRQW